MSRRVTRYRHYWYPHIINMLYKFPNLENTPRGYDEYEAIADTIKEYTNNKDDDSNDTLKLIDYVYFKKTYTLEGASRKVYISKGKAYKLKDKFIKKVAERLGYEK